MKKGQAAMEFLMTYGWAILVVLVAIGALAYFGVLSPGKYLPEQCIIGPGFSCDAFKIVGTNGAAEIIVRNGGTDELTLVSMVLTKIGGTAVTLACDPAIVPVGSTTSCTATNDNLKGSAGEAFKGDMAFTYTAAGMAHTKTGDIAVKWE